MTLYLMQHGKAHSPEEHPERPLTFEGEKDVKKSARFLRQANIIIPTIMHSDKMRAKQTAQLINKEMDSNATLIEDDELGPEADILPVVMTLVSAEKDLLIVGHLPFLDRLASYLITKNKSQSILEFQPGGICCLQKTVEKHWSLIWMMLPGLLRSEELVKN